MNRNRKTLALLALGVSAFLLSRGILDMILVRGDQLTSGNPVMRAIFAVTYVVAAMLLVPYGRDAFFIARRNRSVVALLVLALVSCLWAQTPGLVLQRSVAVLGTTLVGIAFATRLSVEEQLGVFSWVFRTLAFLSLGCVLLFPGLGISQLAEGSHEWQGVFGYKNALGAMMAVSMLVEWYRPADGRFAQAMKWLTLAAGAVLLVFSNSVTAVLALAASFLLLETYRFARQRLGIPLYAIMLVMLVIALSGAAVVLVDSDSVTGVFGRSSNFTGRTQIWSMVASYISERPVLGYGYSGFWYGSSPESAAIDQALGMPIMYAHNGYLESLLDLGVVGFLFTMFFLGNGLWRAYRCSERDHARTNLWPLAFLTFFLLYNLGECTILLQELQWMICVAVIASADGALFLPAAEPEDEFPAGHLGCLPVDETA